MKTSIFSTETLFGILVTRLQAKKEKQDTRDTQPGVVMSPPEIIAGFYELCGQKKVDQALALWMPSRRTSGRRRMIENIVRFQIDKVAIADMTINSAVCEVVATGRSKGEKVFTWSFDAHFLKHEGKWKMDAWKT